MRIVERVEFWLAFVLTAALLMAAGLVMVVWPALDADPEDLVVPAPLADVQTSSATLTFGSLEHVHEAYDAHLAAHAAATAAYEADPLGQDYADMLAILELRTDEYRAALAAWEESDGS